MSKKNVLKSLQMLNVRIASSAGPVISAKQMFRLRKTKIVVGVRNEENRQDTAIRNWKFFVVKNVHRMSRNSSYHVKRTKMQCFWWNYGDVGKRRSGVLGFLNYFFFRLENCHFSFLLSTSSVNQLKYWRRRTSLFRGKQQK